MTTPQLDHFLIEIEIKDIPERKEFEFYYFSDGTEQQRECVFNKLSEDLKKETNGRPFSIKSVVNKNFKIGLQ